MMLLEHRGETKTAVELRAMVEEMDYDKNRKLSFLEWSTCRYGKSWIDLHDFSDDGARAAAMKIIEESCREQERIRNEIEEVKRAREEAEEKRNKEIEEEKKLSGVAGKAAFFKRQIEDSEDGTMTNEERIKADAARRRQIREAKKKQSEAEEAAKNSQMTQEDAERMMQEERERADEEKRQEEERQAKEKADQRAAFKAKQRAMWENK